MGEFAQTQSERSRGKINKRERKEIYKEISSRIEMEKFRKEEDERKKERAILQQEEKGYTVQLLELGKLCALVEKFDLIELNEQQIPQVGPFENPKQTTSFANGYSTGKILAKNFTEENYHQFLETYENKYQVKNQKSK